MLYLMLASFIATSLYLSYFILGFRGFLVFLPCYILYRRLSHATYTGTRNWPWLRHYLPLWTILRAVYPVSLQRLSLTGEAIMNTPLNPWHVKRDEESDPNDADEPCIIIAGPHAQLAWHVGMGAMIGEELGVNVAVGMYPSTINTWFWGDLMMYLGAIAYRWSAIRYLIQGKRRSVVLMPGGFYEIDQPPDSTGLHLKIIDQRRKLTHRAYDANIPILLTYCPAEAKLCVVYRNQNSFIDAIRNWTRKHIFRGHHSWPTRFIGPLPFRSLTIYAFAHPIRRIEHETCNQFQERVEREYKTLKAAALRRQNAKLDA